MEGAWRAEAEVVVFLDSHIEAYGLVWQFSDPKTFTSKFLKNSDSFDSCFCNMYVYRFVIFPSGLLALVHRKYLAQGSGSVFPNTCSSTDCKMAKTQVGVTEL